MPGEPGHLLTTRAAVLGSPVAHSLSPVLHTAAYRALGLDDWEYTVVDVPEAGLEPYVRGLGPQWRGLSLTMPLKEVALEVAGSASELARSTGVVNTLVHGADGDWRGENTDVHGVRVGLAEAGIERVGEAVIVGSGATARSAIAALAALGAQQVHLMVRGSVRPRTTRLLEELGIRVTVRAMGDWPARFDVVVSTVPEGGAAAADTLPPGGSAVLDVVYGGRTSALARVAAEHGYAVVPGTTMLLHQAAEQVRLMTGHDAPVEAMRAALDAALDAAGRVP